MLRDKRVGLLVVDDELRTHLHLLLEQAGALVYPAATEAQLQSFLDRLDLQIVILAGRSDQPPLPDLN